MTFGKRLTDLVLALVMFVVLLPLMVVIGLAVLVRDGPPIFYGHRRVSRPGKEFTLWKFRTMRRVRNDHGVSGGHKRRRVTPLGRFLRHHRLDEFPQLINVIRGDISFVGPRPPDPRYVEMFPELYAEVLKMRPGITGLATLSYHKHEERLLSKCRTAAETEEVYTRRCVPRKAQLDMLYAEHRTFCYDILLMLRTVFRSLPLHLSRWR
ncbi:sugar transferase [Sinisalibacter lacisalsi]|uniref:Sugar transferase n=1 Tax=Sinisalibacter lacisalsi TaxID=1526570 RepID=A0ABQ1QP78_9RHOB|nr:sugar transferase [Sinisalibacter lacisalsi]GGD36325.1 sugar transferase [Sinisalibacter lacisalsi]